MRPPVKKRGSRGKKRSVGGTFSSKTNFINKKKLLRESFSKVNAGMQRSNDSLFSTEGEGTNVFMDILKIAPVIDLVDEEASQDERQCAEEEEPEASTSKARKKKKTLTTASIISTMTTKKTGKNIVRTMVKVEPKSSEEELVLVEEANTSTMSVSTLVSQQDIDLREEPSAEVLMRRSKTILKKARRRLSPCNKTKRGRISRSSIICLLPKNDVEEGTNGMGVEKPRAGTSDMDIRRDVQLTEPGPLKNAHQSRKKSKSISNSKAAAGDGGEGEKEDGAGKSTFISRVRRSSLSTPVDLSKRYQLLGLRYFQTIKGQELAEAQSAHSLVVPLSVVSFNVLCQHSKEAVPFLYSHLEWPPNVNRREQGQWPSRMPKLQAEFDRLAADVFCLQEVQDDHFEQFYFPYFKSRNYRAQFTRRTASDTPDGCAVFWRPSKLEMLQFKPIIYNLHTDGMNKDNVGQVILFGVLGTGAVLCLSNTHILYNMKRGDIKLAQIAFLLATVQKMESEFRKKVAAGTNSPTGNGTQYKHFAGHIICGDFNMEPNSQLHRFIVDGKIDLRQADRFQLAWAPRQSPACQQQARIDTMFGRPQAFLGLPMREMRLSPNCTFVETNAELMDIKSTPELRHLMKLASVYEHWNIRGERELSSYHKDQSQPDFIFYSVAEQSELKVPDHDNKKMSREDCELLNSVDKELAYEAFIQLRKRLSLPTKLELDAAGGRLPNEQHGSDHLSLLAAFDILCLPPPEQQKQQKCGPAADDKVEGRNRPR